MRVLGIDPDSKDMSFATWGPDGPEDAHVTHVRGPSSNYQMLRALTSTALGWAGELDLVVIEGQQVDRRRARPADLFKLAHMTGAVALNVRIHYPTTRLVIPTPKQWKGSVAKHAMQSRMYSELGWGYTIIGSGTSRYARPNNPPKRYDHISKGQWKHVGDALLLAKWGYEN